MLTTMTGNRDVAYTLEAFISNHISIEEAVAVLSQHLNDAKFDLPYVLSDITPGTKATRHESQTAILSIMHLCWKILDRQSLMHQFVPVYNNPIGATFFDEKLREEPDAFDDHLLEEIERWWSSLTPKITELRTTRIKQKSSQLLAQPRQLQEDVKRVRDYVTGYSFNPGLNDLLAKVEDELVVGGDAFDRSATLKHLRTFFEKIHKESGERLRHEKPETVDGTNLSSCGQAIDFLMRNRVLTDKMRDMAKALYGVLSNEGVHAIKSEREYVRLCRNMIAEYALVLFFELDRRLAE